MKILVSACLLGKNCKYNGHNNKQERLLEFLNNYEVIPVCPEVLGGLSIPREPAEIRSKKVINKKNIDVTENYKKGAQLTLDIIKKENIKVAILKKNSPSCGYGYIYDGTFSHKLIKGNGITADLLNKEGIIILNEENYLEYFKDDYG